MPVFREFRNASKSGKTRVWRIAVVGPQIHTEWGEVGGKFQTGLDTGQWKNRGQSNEITPEMDALNEAERIIRSKLREGYTEGSGKEPRIATSIDFRYRLPESLRFWKPDNGIGDYLMGKLRRDEVLFGRKRDGEGYPTVIAAEHEVAMYSRKMHRHHHHELGGPGWEARFPHIADEVRELDLPPGTVFLGELVFSPGADLRWNTAQVIRAKTEEALATQHKRGELHYYIWDIAFYDGKCLLQTVPTGERYGMIHDLVGSANLPHLLPIETYTPAEIREMASRIDTTAIWNGKHEFGEPVVPEDAPAIWTDAVTVSLANKWEGFVVVDPDATFGDQAYNLLGKDSRPARAAGKLKPFFEDDFIMVLDPNSDIGEIADVLGEDPEFRGSWGRGKRDGGAGAVSLYQYNSDGELIYICECGGGFDDAFVAEYSDPTKYPLVGQVRYETRTYKKQGGKTNALQFPRIISVRTDKTPDECVNPRL